MIVWLFPKRSPKKNVSEQPPYGAVWRRVGDAGLGFRV